MIAAGIGEDDGAGLAQTLVQQSSTMTAICSSSLRLALRLASPKPDEEFAPTVDRALADAPDAVRILAWTDTDSHEFTVEQIIREHSGREPQRAGEKSKVILLTSGTTRNVPKECHEPQVGADWAGSGEPSGAHAVARRGGTDGHVTPMFPWRGVG